MYQVNRMDAPNPNTTNASCSDVKPEALTNQTEPVMGTLVWVGDRLSTESVDVYRYCEANAPQLAYRASMEDAVARPATGVSQILIHRSGRQPLFERQLKQLACAYPQATLIEMFGAMWEGHVYQRDLPLQTHQFYWHQWNQDLPPLLGRFFATSPEATLGSLHQSVAIIASSFADADPLLDLAASVNATSLWCRSQQLVTARNCGVLWWDDSAAKATSEAGWRERIKSVEKYSTIQPKHVWLTGVPRFHQYLDARKAGIDIIFSKPHRIEALISTLVRTDTEIDTRTGMATRPNVATAANSQAKIKRIKVAA